MATSPRYAVKFRRRREGKTSYKKRLALLKSNLPRLVIRRSNKYITSEVIDYAKKGDKVLAHTHSSHLKKDGWKFGVGNLPAAYLTGLKLGAKLKGKVKKAVLDHGLCTSTKGSLIYACLKGFLDSGIEVKHNPKIFPDESRIKGEHIAKYSKKPDITKNFENVKKKIMS
jgi:large subunit ribosomal protein L18